MTKLWYRLLKLWTGYDYARVLPAKQALPAHWSSDCIVRIEWDAFLQPYTLIRGEPCYENNFVNGRFEPITY